MLSRRVFVAAGASLLGAQENTRMFGDAAAYEGYMGRWSRLLAPLFIDLANIPDGTSILDVGCGTGVLSFAIAERRPHCRVVGVDVSQEYVGYAVSKTPPGVQTQFEVGDAQRLRFASASFDQSLALLVFNFIPDSAKAIAETIRVTRPGGSITAAVWDYGRGMRMLRVFWDAAGAVDPEAAKIDEKDMPLCSPGELASLWKKAGLTNVEDRPLQITMRFSSFADYWDPFLHGQGPAGTYARKTNGAQREALRAELKRRLGVVSENQAFELTARAWAARGIVPRPR